RHEGRLLKLRYTAWDGTQRVRLDPQHIFEKLAEYLSYTDDVQQALDWLLRQGLDLEGMRVMGIDELLESRREEVRKRYEQYNLHSALDEIRERLDDIVRREREAVERALEEGADESRMREKRALLDDLPERLSEAMTRLAQQYQFEDEAAERDFRDLLDELDNIRDLEEFQRKHGDKFHGEEELGYADAVELMREIEAIRKIEEDLASRN